MSATLNAPLIGAINDTDPHDGTVGEPTAVLNSSGLRAHNSSIVDTSADLPVVYQASDYSDDDHGEGSDDNGADPHDGSVVEPTAVLNSSGVRAHNSSIVDTSADLPVVYQASDYSDDDHGEDGDDNGGTGPTGHGDSSKPPADGWRAYAELAGQPYLVGLHIPNAAQGACLGLLTPVIPLLSSTAGLTPMECGAVLACIGIGRVVIGLPAIPMIHVLGPRWAMALACLIYAASTIVVFFYRTVVSLLLCTTLWGIAFGLFLLPRHQVLRAAVEAGRRGRLSSLIGGGMRWAMVVGPLVGGVVVDRFGPYAALGAQFPIIVIGAVCVLASGLVRRVASEQKQSSSSATSTAPKPQDNEATPLSITTSAAQLPTGHVVQPTQKALVTVMKLHWRSFLSTGSYAFTVFALRTGRRYALPFAAMHRGLSSTSVGALVAGSFAVDASLFFLSGLVMDKIGRRAAAVPTSALLGLAFAMTAATEDNLLLLILTALFFGVADSVGSGLLLALIADETPTENSAAYLAVMRMIQDAGLVAGALVPAVMTTATKLPYACVLMAVWGIANGLLAYAHIAVPPKNEIPKAAATCEASELEAGNHSADLTTHPAVLPQAADTAGA